MLLAALLLPLAFTAPISAGGRAAVRPRMQMEFWLDARGKPCDDDLTVLLDLYGKVRKELDRAGLPPPTGAAVSGVLHAQADLADEAGEDGELNLLAVGADGESLLYGDGKRAGVALVASPSESKAQIDAVHAAIRMPERHVALLAGGSDDDTLALFDFALAQAQHCRKISGCNTALLVELREQRALASARRTAAQDQEGVPISIVLAADAALWVEALRPLE